MEVDNLKKIDVEGVLNSYKYLYEKKVYTDFIIVSGDNIDLTFIELIC